MCSGCGMPMSVQGRSQKPSGLTSVLKIAGLGLLALIAVIVVWQISVWGFHKTVGYDIKGKWRAEATSILGVSIPVGLNLEFNETTAMVLDQQVQVLEYERDGKKVVVAIKGDAGIQVNLVFIFADQNHMAFEGPFGFSLRYRRIKEH